MDDIKSIINKVIGDIAEHNPSIHDKVERIWQNLLSAKERQHTKLDGIKDGTLNVLVDSPAWLYQMKIRQRRICTQLKEELSDIHQIRFRIGKVK